MMLQECANKLLVYNFWKQNWKILTATCITLDGDNKLYLIFETKTFIIYVSRLHVFSKTINLSLTSNFSTKLVGRSRFSKMPHSHNCITAYDWPRFDRPRPGRAVIWDSWLFARRVRTWSSLLYIFDFLCLLS